MPLRALEPYEVRETGVGCTDHGDPDCLCDIHVTEPAPITWFPEQFESVQELLDNVDDFLTEVERTGCERRIKDALSDARDGGEGRSERRYELYRALWAEGMFTVEIADRLGVSPHEVLEVGLRDSQVDVFDKVLELEDLIQTATCIEDMMEQTGMGRLAIIAHLQRLGVAVPTSKRDLVIIRGRLIAADQGITLYKGIQQAAEQLGWPEMARAAYLSASKVGHSSTRKAAFKG